MPPATDADAPHSSRRPSSRPARSSSYFSYPISYAVSGILRRLTTDPDTKESAKNSDTSLSHSLASLVDTPSSSASMHSVFQPQQRMPSPFQPPPLTPLSLKGYGSTMREKGKLLNKALAEEIRLLVPPRLQLVDEWTLAYSLEQNGVSLATLYQKSEEHWGKRGGFVLVVRDGGGGVCLCREKNKVRMLILGNRLLAHISLMPHDPRRTFTATASAFFGEHKSLALSQTLPISHHLPRQIPRMRSE